MSGRLAARVTVDALRRLAERAGGQATVLARGDPDAGTILLVVLDRDGRERVFERTPSGFGPVRWEAIGPAVAPADYLARRRASDPDLWAVELANLPDPAAVMEAVLG